MSAPTTDEILARLGGMTITLNGNDEQAVPFNAEESRWLASTVRSLATENAKLLRVVDASEESLDGTRPAQAGE